VLPGAPESSLQPEDIFFSPDVVDKRKLTLPYIDVSRIKQNMNGSSVQRFEPESWLKIYSSQAVMH
jgi:hypothetical protein